MRLLRLEENGEFSLVEHIGRNIPRYAILSHTWGADNEEVTFKDLTEGTGKTKAGYRKLKLCAELTARDNLNWFWVDTCCIDKSSSAELSEAINSMFRWYHQSAKCYIYLSDVWTSDFNGHGHSFQESRWFTRGWTLQELLAPTSAEFFSAEGNRLGDRYSLMQEIKKITGISVPALQGSRLSQFSVEERISWARGRETKREEDMAYSLLGIFDIQIPLIYGEGQEKALKRLHKEIKEASTDQSPAQYSLPLFENLSKLDSSSNVQIDDESNTHLDSSNMISTVHVQTLEGHGQYVRSVAFSPDSTQMVSASVLSDSGPAFSEIKFWDVRGGDCFQTFTIPGYVRSVALSPDPARLATGSYDLRSRRGKIQIRNVRSGECLQTFHSFSGEVKFLAYSPNSVWLASGSFDKEIKLWDASSGKYLQTLRGHSSVINSIAFSPDSSQLASGSWDKTVKLWKVS